MKKFLVLSVMASACLIGCGGGAAEDESAADAIDAIGEAAEEAIEEVGDAAEEAIEEVGDAAEEAMPESAPAE